MGFMSETPVICQRCRKTFYCGCVITNVCPDCNREECHHEVVLTELGRFCKKCYHVMPPQ